MKRMELALIGVSFPVISMELETGTRICAFSQELRFSNRCPSVQSVVPNALKRRR